MAGMDLETLKQHLGRGAFDQARELINSRRTAGEDVAKALSLAGMAAYQKEANAAAIEFFAILDALSGLSAMEWAMSAHAAERLGDTARAAHAYGQALAQDPSMLQAHFNRANVLLKRRDWAQAIHHLEECRRLNPGFVPALENLAEALKSVGRYEDAIAIYQDLLRGDQGRLDLRLAIAGVHAEAGDFERAEKGFRQIIEAEPKLTDAWDGLVALLALEKRFDAAETAAQEAESHGVHSANMAEITASVAMEKGDTAAALEKYRASLDEDPANRRTRRNLVEALVKTGATEEALELCDGPLSAYPGDPEMLAYKAIVLTAMGRQEEERTITQHDRLVMPYRPICPPGYASLKAFNEALVQHVKTHPSLVVSPPNNATRSGSHTGILLTDPLGPFADFRDIIGQAARQYLRAHPHRDHPFFERWADEWGLSVWGVVMPEGGHQIPHIHPSGFLSGVYYPYLPPQVRSESDTEGAIEFGGAPEQFDLPTPPTLTLVTPEEGLMMLFPSFLFHRTLPFSGDDERVSIAFDLIPI